MVDLLPIIVPASWTFFATYILWYVTSSTCNAAITLRRSKSTVLQAQEKLQMHQPRMEAAVA